MKSKPNFLKIIPIPLISLFIAFVLYNGVSNVPFDSSRQKFFLVGIGIVALALIYFTLSFFGKAFSRVEFLSDKLVIRRLFKQEMVLAYADIKRFDFYFERYNSTELATIDGVSIFFKNGQLLRNVPFTYYRNQPELFQVCDYINQRIKSGERIDIQGFVPQENEFNVNNLSEIKGEPIARFIRGKKWFLNTFAFTVIPLIFMLILLAYKYRNSANWPLGLSFSFLITLPFIGLYLKELFCFELYENGILVYHRLFKNYRRFYLYQDIRLAIFSLARKNSYSKISLRLISNHFFSVCYGSDVLDYKQWDEFDKLLTQRGVSVYNQKKMADGELTKLNPVPME